MSRSNRNRGQASLEMVANYAWAVLVVAAVAVALWRFGAFESPQVVEKSKQGFSGVEVLDFKLLSLDNDPSQAYITGTLTTTSPRPIRIAAIRGKIEEDLCRLGTDCGDNSWEIGEVQFTNVAHQGVCNKTAPDECPTFGVGDSFTFLVGEINEGSGSTASWPSPDSSAVISVILEIEYEDAETGIDHKSSGKLTSRVAGYIATS